MVVDNKFLIQFLHQLYKSIYSCTLTFHRSSESKQFTKVRTLSKLRTISPWLFGEFSCWIESIDRSKIDYNSMSKLRGPYSAALLQLYYFVTRPCDVSSSTLLVARTCNYEWYQCCNYNAYIPYIELRDDASYWKISPDIITQSWVWYFFLLILFEQLASAQRCEQFVWLCSFRYYRVLDVQKQNYWNLQGIVSMNSFGVEALSLQNNVLLILLFAFITDLLEIRINIILIGSEGTGSSSYRNYEFIETTLTVWTATNIRERKRRKTTFSGLYSRPILSLCTIPRDCHWSSKIYYFLTLVILKSMHYCCSQNTISCRPYP